MQKFLFILFILIVQVAGSKELLINNIKLELPNMLYGDYSLSAERKVYNNMSASIRLGYLQPFNRPARKYNWNLNGKKSGFDASLEYRIFVVGKNRNELQGIYLAPYLRYATLSLDFLGEIQQSPIGVDLSYSNVGAGIQLGFQKQLGRNKPEGHFLKHLIYDFHLLGMGFDRHSLTMSFRELKNPDEYDYGLVEDEVREFLEKYPFIANRLDFNYLNNLLKVKLPLVLPGLRAGFSVGYVFSSKKVKSIPEWWER